jgi:hypothetical protein
LKKRNLRIMASDFEPNPRAVPQDNKPPVVDPDLLAREHERVTAFANAAVEWAKKGVDSEEAAGKLTDFITGARKVRTDIVAKKADAKRPHLDANNEIERLFSILERVVEDSLTKVRPLMDGWLKKQREEAERIAAAEREQAIAAAEAAREAQRAAQRRGDLMGYSEAMDAEKASGIALGRLPAAGGR